MRAWRAVEIDATGWRVIDNPPVRFRRAAGMKPLPTPVSGGSIEMLRPFLNVQSDTDFVLVVAWALAVLRDRGPYPVLVLSGEQGSAKSTFSAILRALLDPNTAPLRALPREDRELFIAANNGHVLTFDNVSGLPSWISDTLCRLGDRRRICRASALHRSRRSPVRRRPADHPEWHRGHRGTARPRRPRLFLTLEPISEDRRRPEAELWAAFNHDRPRILGALLDAVVEGLKRLPETRLPKPPRMADFALWATACETALWPAGTFWSAYCRNRDEAVEGVIEANPVAAALRTLMSMRPEWRGTASELLVALGQITDEPIAEFKEWPRSPRSLSGKLRRVAPFLRKIGVEIKFGDREGRARNRIIRITAPDCCGTDPSAPSASSGAEEPNIADDG